MTSDKDNHRERNQYYIYFSLNDLKKKDNDRETNQYYIKYNRYINLILEQRTSDKVTSISLFVYRTSNIQTTFQKTKGPNHVD